MSSEWAAQQGLSVYTPIIVKYRDEKTDLATTQPRTTLVGYQFAWSNERRQWLPWKNVVYADPNDVHLGVLF